MKRLKRWLAIILMGVVAHLLVPWSVSAQRTEEEQKAEDVQQQAEEAQKALELFLRRERVVFRAGGASARTRPIIQSGHKRDVPAQ